jgi:adenylylsulfate kinase
VGRFFLSTSIDVDKMAIKMHMNSCDTPSLTIPETQDVNAVWHQPSVDRLKREHMNQHKSFVLWFTGLSGAGKSTLSHYIEQLLHERGYRTYVLDGDNVRHGLCSDLGFSLDDRHENIRRVSEVCKLFIDAGHIVLTAFISPLREDRQKARQCIGAQDFIEIYCSADIEVCEERDPKGYYKKARAGLIGNFTGISSPYEAPINPELVIDTAIWPLSECADLVLDYLESKGQLVRW